jgi:hypothetical protein
MRVPLADLREAAACGSHALLCSLLVLLACGGSSKPAATEADTSSLESSSGGAASSSPTAAAPGSAATDTPAAATASTPATPPPSDAAPPAEFHPVPGATGDIDGKPFTPKLAQLAGPVQKDGRVLVMIHQGTDCVAPEDAKSGDGSMLLLVPWKDGYKTDLSALRRARGGNLGEAAFIRKKQVSTTFKPSGLLTVVSAPTQKGTVGKMKIDLQSGGYILAGDLDVKVCGTP